ncbi:hypothetical protein C1646_763078 [Rhizophagus diaphanus]|nr:hypothetical protein C1646_763078 [Rhizophagus diaphanus] [Rhizophagus sp. MUCL 43196]
MSNETEILIIILIIIILIKYNKLEESLNTYQIDQEEENYNILPISLLYLQQLNRIKINERINLRKLNRTISQYWFNEICLNMQDFEFKRHFRLTKSTFEWLSCCEIIPLLRREIIGSNMVGLV